MSDSDFNPFLLDGVDRGLYIGDEDSVLLEATEHEHYLIVPNPTNEEEENDDWAVLLLTEPYVDFLIKFDNIETRGDEMLFDYVVLSIPEDEVEVEEVAFGNHLSSVLISVLRQFKEDGVLIEEEI